MKSQVQQLCEFIAKHPSKINMINDVFSLMFKAPNRGDLRCVVKLLEGMIKKKQS